MPVSKAFISVYDIGLLRGYAIYDGITAFGKKVFRLPDHMKRFRNSAKAMSLKVPHTDSEIKKIIETLVKKNGFARTNLRLILTGGQTLFGIDYDYDKPTFFILAEEFSPLPKEFYESGATLVTVEHQRFMPESKTTNYITAVKSQSKRKGAKAVEVLFTSNGEVLECSTSNIAIFKGDKIIAPDKNILGGITLKVVLELAKKKFKIERRTFKLKELLTADEVFITSSYKDIVPIISVDSKKIGNGKIGPKTKILMELFANYTRL